MTRFLKKSEKTLDKEISICYNNKVANNAGMAQSVEHVIGNDEVISSILITSSRKKHICVADVLFSTKFALRSSEIASLWNICFANVKYSLTRMWANFISHRPKGDISQCAIAHYFTFGGSRIFHLKNCRFYAIIKQGKEAVALPSTNIWIMCVIMIILSPISWFILNEYGIRYRVMRKILKKRWLYSAVTYSLLSSNLLLLLAAWVFPNWWLYILGGIWIGTVGQFPPLYPGPRSIYLISYKGSYEIYVEHADLLEKNLKEKQEKRMKRKKKRKSKK